VATRFSGSFCLWCACWQPLDKNGNTQVGDGIFARETALGRVIGGLYHAVNWQTINNDFVRRAKEAYDDNVKLTGYVAFSYNEAAVVALFQAAVGPHKYDAVMQSMSLFKLHQQYEKEIMTDRSYVINAGFGEKKNHVIIVGCYSAVAARTAAYVFGNAFSQLGMVGRANVSGRSVFLVTDQLSQHERILELLNATGLDLMKTWFSTKRITLMSKVFEAAPVVRIPSDQGGQELVKVVPETFTDVDCELDKVLVLDADKRLRSVRKDLGVYMYGDFAGVVARDEYTAVSWYCNGRNVKISSTPSLRNITLFKDLMEVGVIARPAWLELVD
jgi:hypothetical protein